MALEEKTSKPALMNFSGLSFIVLPAMICLVLVFPARVNARTSLLRTDPANNAILRTSPGQVRLWFSAVVSPEFSTAVVEDAAHEYVNTRDAYLSPRDAHEMDVPLPPHLVPGVYTVVWRADSNSDGLILDGAYSFAVMQPGETVSRQNSQSSGLFPGQFESLLHLFLLILLLVALCLLVLCLLRMVVTARGGDQDHRDFDRNLVKKITPHFIRTLSWKSLVGAAVLICLGLGIIQTVSGKFSQTRTLPALVLSMQQDTKSALTAFHAVTRTADKQFNVVLDINTTGCCSTMFNMSVRDAASGKQASNVSVVLYTTMLDMHMGTDTVNAWLNGNGRFIVQSDLSMGGLWQVCVAIETADHKSHEACVKVLIPY